MAPSQQKRITAQRVSPGMLLHTFKWLTISFIVPPTPHHSYSLFYYFFRFVSARAALLSGRLPIRTGFYTNNAHARDGGFSLRVGFPIMFVTMRGCQFQLSKYFSSKELQSLQNPFAKKMMHHIHMRPDKRVRYAVLTGRLLKKMSFIDFWMEGVGNVCA